MPASTSLPGLSGRENTFSVRMVRVASSTTAKSVKKPPISTPILKPIALSLPVYSDDAWERFDCMHSIASQGLLAADLLVPLFDPTRRMLGDLFEFHPDRLVLRGDAGRDPRVVLHIAIRRRVLHRVDETALTFGGRKFVEELPAERRAVLHLLRHVRECHGARRRTDETDVGIVRVVLSPGPTVVVHRDIDIA